MSGRVVATAGRVLGQLRQDHRTLALLLVVPALLIGLVAWIFSATDAFARIGPAMLAMFPFTVMFVVTSVATLRERRSGTLERLATLPIGRGEFIAGYALAFGLLAVVQTLVAAAMAIWAAGLEVDGSLGLLVLVAVADALLGTALGLCASAFARTEFQVVQFMPAFVFPQILLGGIFLPRDRLPGILEAVSDVLPLSHGVDALDAVTRDSHDPAWILTRLAIVAGWILAALTLAALTLRGRTP